MPVIATRCPAHVAHALLDHRPFPVRRNEEPMQIKVEPVLNRGTIDFRNEPAGTAKDGHRVPFGHPELKFIRRLAGVLTPPAAYIDPELFLDGSKPAFEGANTLVVIPEECQSIPITEPND